VKAALTKVVGLTQFLLILTKAVSLCQHETSSILHVLLLLFIKPKIVRAKGDAKSHSRFQNINEYMNRVIFSEK